MTETYAQAAFPRPAFRFGEPVELLEHGYPVAAGSVGVVVSYVLLEPMIYSVLFPGASSLDARIAIPEGELARALWPSSGEPPAGIEIRPGRDQLVPSSIDVARAMANAPRLAPLLSSCENDQKLISGPSLNPETAGLSGGGPIEGAAGSASARPGSQDSPGSPEAAQADREDLLKLATALERMARAAFEGRMRTLDYEEMRTVCEISAGVFRKLAGQESP